MKNMRDKIEKILIETTLKILREYKKGCLFIIKEGVLNYELQMENDFKPFNILDNGRRLEPFALQSGACIIDIKGNIIAYSARILNTKTYPNFGTRHSAGYTSSLTGNIAIVGSDDDMKVRIFKDGKLVMQLDALEKNIANKVPDAVNIFESLGVGFTATYGLTTLVPTLSTGLQIIPGIILFGSTYAIIRFLTKK